MPRKANHSPHSACVIVRTAFANHLVWIPRYRKMVLVGPVEARLKELLAEIAIQYGFEILAVEVMPDHVHLFVSGPPKFSPAEIVRLFKGITSRRLKKSLRMPRIRTVSVTSIGANMRHCGRKDITWVRLDTLARKPSSGILKKVKRNSNCSGIKPTMAVYLNQYQMLPLERVRETFADVFEHPLAEGTIFEAGQAVAEQVVPVNNAIK